MAVPAGALIFGRRSIAGSLIGGIAETQEMLDFCAEHDVGARDRGHRPRLHQRGLRADAGQRRALPLRHRYRVAALERYAYATRLDAGQWPARRRQLGRDPLDVLRAGVVMGDVGDELRDLVAGDLAVGRAPRRPRR